MDFLKNNVWINRMLDLILLVPLYWIIYALPYCFSLPFKRIPMPWPFFDNTALAPSIISSAVAYIISSISARRIPSFFRICAPVLTVIMGITSYELVHGSLYRLFNPNYGHLMFRINLTLILFIESCMLYMFHKYLQGKNIKLLSINRPVAVAGIFYILLTLYQVQRGFYITIVNDHITLLQQISLFWMYPFLMFRGIGEVK